ALELVRDGLPPEPDAGAAAPGPARGRLAARAPARRPRRPRGGVPEHRAVELLARLPGAHSRAPGRRAGRRRGLERLGDARGDRADPHVVAVLFRRVPAADACPAVHDVVAPDAVVERGRALRERRCGLDDPATVGLLDRLPAVQVVAFAEVAVLDALPRDGADRR